MQNKGKIPICSICFQTAETRGQINCCQHIYCLSCILTWAKNENSCPNCRRLFNFVTPIPLMPSRLRQKRRQKPIYVPFKKQSATTIRMTVRQMQECGITIQTYLRAITNPRYPQEMQRLGFPHLQIVSDENSEQFLLYEVDEEAL